MERGRWYGVLEGAARLADGRSRGRGRRRAGERLERPDGRDRGEWAKADGHRARACEWTKWLSGTGMRGDETDTAGAELEQVERLAVWNS